MTGLELMQRAFSSQPTEGLVPLWELEFQAWDQASGRHIVLGREFERLTAGEQSRALSVNAQIIAAVADELGFSAVTVPGRYWEIAPGEPAYYWLPPDARLEQIRLIRKLLGGRVMIVAVSGGVMAMPGAQSYVEFSYKLFDAPEQIDQTAREIVAGGLQTAAMLRDLGVEAVVTASDIADNRGPFFSPPQMERFILPYLRQWAAGVKAMGLRAILHTDGDIRPCMESLATSGVEAIQAIDPTAGMDMRSALAAARGRVCLCGNIDCGLLLTGQPGDLYAATAKMLAECGSTPGLVLGASNAVQPETPIENYRQVVAALRDYQRSASGRQLST